MSFEQLQQFAWNWVEAQYLEGNPQENLAPVLEFVTWLEHKIH